MSEIVYTFNKEDLENFDEPDSTSITILHKEKILILANNFFIDTSLNIYKKKEKDFVIEVSSTTVWTVCFLVLTLFVVSLYHIFNIPSFAYLFSMKSIISVGIIFVIFIFFVAFCITIFENSKITGIKISKYGEKVISIVFLIGFAVLTLFITYILLK